MVVAAVLLDEGEGGQSPRPMMMMRRLWRAIFGELHGGEFEVGFFGDRIDGAREVRLLDAGRSRHVASDRAMSDE